MSRRAALEVVPVGESAVATFRQVREPRAVVPQRSPHWSRSADERSLSTVVSVTSETPVLLVPSKRHE